MNIGFVTQALPYLPSVGGFRLYGANLIRCLSQRHSIHLVSVLRDQDSEHMDWPRQYCESVTGVSLRKHNVFARGLNVTSRFVRGTLVTGQRELAEAVKQNAAAGRWDIMHVEGSAAASMVKDIQDIPRVLSVHDSGTLRCKEMLKCSQSVSEQFYYRWLQHFQPRFERLLFPGYEAVTVVAQPDQEEVRRVVPNVDVTLIPNGIDTDYFAPAAVQKTSMTVVFHSHLGYPPNIEAALEFADEILPLVHKKLPNVTFHLVGAKPGAKIMELAVRAGIRISADVPDVRPEVCSAQVYVCPIRYGTGIKNKMLEAMAMQMPIVGYPAATVGLGCTHGKHLMEAHTPEEFARYTVELLENPHHAAVLANNGRRLVEEKFSWESRAIAYERLYEEIRDRKMLLEVSACVSQD